RSHPPSDGPRSPAASSLDVCCFHPAPDASYAVTNSCFLQAAKTKSAAAQAEADKKAERLAKLEAWKKKKESQAAKEKEANPLQTRRLLAEMDEKAHKPSSAAA